MRVIGAMFLCFFVYTASAGQFALTASSPANGDVNVPAGHITLTLTFSGELDTTALWENSSSYFTNIDSIAFSGYTSDHTAAMFDGVVKADSTYMFALVGARAAGGVTTLSPSVIMFTAAAQFSGTTMSGTVVLDGMSPANCMVFVSAQSISGHDNPRFIAGTVTDNLGNFTIPHVPQGALYPIAGKDVDGNAVLNPEVGDMVGIGSQVNVGGTPVSGVEIVLKKWEPMSILESHDSLPGVIAALPSDYSLRIIEAWDVDSTARAQSWLWDFTSASSSKQYQIRVDHSGTSIDSVSNYSWWNNLRPIPDLSGAALPDTFFAKIERSGGAAFRHQAMPDSLKFRAEVKLGDLGHSEYADIAPDPSKFYWGATYSFERRITNDSSYRVAFKRYLGSFETGDVVVVTGVAGGSSSPVAPATFSLAQNYPNPFNPATKIQYSVATESLVRLTVHDLLGREVATLVNARMQPGMHQVVFDASRLSTGVYFYRIQAGRYVETRKMILVR